MFKLLVSKYFSIRTATRWTERWKGEVSAYEEKAKFSAAAIMTASRALSNAGCVLCYVHGWVYRNCLVQDRRSGEMPAELSVCQWFALATAYWLHSKCLCVIRSRGRSVIFYVPTGTGRAQVPIITCINRRDWSQVEYEHRIDFDRRVRVRSGTSKTFPNRSGTGAKNAAHGMLYSDNQFSEVAAEMQRQNEQDPILHH